MTKPEPPVHRYQITDYPELSKVWDLVRSLSIVPDDLDMDTYQQHIEQPKLVDTRAEIEALPTAERIAYEYATCEQDQRSPKTIHRPLRRLQDKNGVVKIGPGMDREPRKQLKQLLAEFFGQPILESGNYLYPPGGFKEWHTNMASVPGWRMYIVNKSTEGKSFFRYVDPHSMTLQTVWDETGQINIFRLAPDYPFWHAVASIDAYRWSKGFVIPDNWRDRLIG